MVIDFVKWADKQPDDIHVGQILTWRTAHVRLGMKMTMTGIVRRMCNGWTGAYHLLPPMTHWNGYNHSIPKDLEWSYGVPRDIAEIELTSCNHHRFVRLLHVEGISLLPCPRCGADAVWESLGGFIGAMPHQEERFSAGCCYRTGSYESPESAAKYWNTRASDPRVQALVEAVTHEREMVCQDFDMQRAASNAVDAALAAFKGAAE
mgnify:FL=1|jgi:hypothetical protein